MIIFVKRVGRIFKILGLDIKAISALRHLPKYINNVFKFRRMGGKIKSYFPILRDFYDSAGVASGHFFHCDLHVAKMIFLDNPARHIDIGSRIDGFVAHVASFRVIEVVDLRDLTTSHKEIKFLKQDLMLPNSEKCDSLSALHVVGHFGLGRYSDEIDKDGHIKGLSNMIDMLLPGGKFYLGIPIGKADEVYFNAHRVFAPDSILKFDCVADSLKLVRFDLVNDSGDLEINMNVEEAVGKYNYGFGIYTFVRV